MDRKPKQAIWGRPSCDCACPRAGESWAQSQPGRVDHLQQVPTGDLLQVGGNKDRNHRCQFLR